MALAVGVFLWAEGSPGRAIRLAAPWAPGELSTYTVVRSGAAAPAPAIGSAQLGVVSRGEHIGLIFDYHEPELSKRADVTVDAVAFLPVSSIITRESPQSGQAVITADYQAADAADIEITSTRGTESVRRELTEGVHYDAEQMVYLLRTMPLKDRFAATFNALDTQGASPASVKVRVVGKETVSVPAGEFECWRLDVQGLSMRAWVAVAAPHQLAIVELVARGTRALLADYVQGGGA